MGLMVLQDKRAGLDRFQPQPLILIYNQVLVALSEMSERANGRRGGVQDADGSSSYGRGSEVQDTDGGRR